MINIDFHDHGGRIAFDDLHIDETRPLFDQLDELKEDLLQVEFPNNYVLDVGWFPSFNIDGQFQIRLVKFQDWENPTYSGASNNISGMYTEVKEALKKLG